jgi:hypothetical protein
LKKVKIISSNENFDTLIELLSHNNNDIKKELLIAKKDEAVYKTSIACNSKRIEFVFNRQDWRGDEDCSTVIKLKFEDMNIQTMEYIYNMVTKFTNKNITKIYEAVEREKKREAIKMFQELAVA